VATPERRLSKTPRQALGDCRGVFLRAPAQRRPVAFFQRLVSAVSGWLSQQRRGSGRDPRHDGDPSVRRLEGGCDQMPGVSSGESPEAANGRRGAPTTGCPTGIPIASPYLTSASSYVTNVAASNRLAAHKCKAS
jgi:hypothetical protein